MNDTTTEYKPVELADAREGDEVLKAGEWRPITSATLHGGKTIAVRYASGGTDVYPARHGIKVRRAVVAGPEETITVAASMNHGGKTYGEIHRHGCSHHLTDPMTFESLPTWVGLSDAVERVIRWTAGEWTAAGCLAPLLTDGVTYRVAYSTRQGSWYISDNAGECVSGMYDAEATAAEALALGEF